MKIKIKLHHVVSFHGIKDEIEVDFAFQYTDSFQENVLSFVNNVKTIDGGTHEIGVKTALTKTINEYAWANGYLKGKDKNLDGSGCQRRNYSNYQCKNTRTFTTIWGTNKIQNLEHLVQGLW